MNYLELIQEVSKVRYRSIPAAWSNVTADADIYYNIREEIDDAAKDIFFAATHNFRKYLTTLATVDGQRSYAQDYGVIHKIQYLNDNSYYQDVKECFDYARMEALYSNSDESIPLYYVIYGEELHLYPTPDDAYTLRIYHNIDKWAKSIATIDQSSASGQANLYVTKTEGFTAGSTIIIEPNTPREEAAVIDSVTEDDYITLTTNLAYTHAVGSKAEYHKRSLDYELDEPNMPSKFHDIVKTKALLELYLGFEDSGQYKKYEKQFKERYNYMIREIKGSENTRPFFNYKG